MKVELNHIGTIKNSTINLGSNLMVFTGPNNSGKTYISYCLYGLSKFRPSYSEEFLLEIFGVSFDSVFDAGFLEIDLAKLTEHIPILEKEYSKQFKNFLPVIFGMDSDFFIKSEVKLKFGSNEEFIYYLENLNLRLNGASIGGLSFSFLKNPKESKLRLTITRNIVEEITPEIQKNALKTLKNLVLQYTINPFNKAGGYFLPAERIGISVFSKELFLNRFSSTNEILSLDEFNRTKVVELLNKNFNRYSLVIQDSLRNQENLSRLKTRKDNKFDLLATELEEKILSGTLTIDENGDVFYNTQDQILKIQATGSIIKSLANFVFYLRYQAHENQLLIIDEPEINLHPNSQRLIAKILAKLSNMGVQVIISTHSDYIIREINNLIMLNKKTEVTNTLIQKFGYDSTEILTPDCVDAYYFHDNITEKIVVKETGFEVESIDNTISLQNQATNEIKWTLFED